MHWGHKIADRGGPVEVTRHEYNTQAGVETPAQPEVPFCALHVWGYWWELNARRPPGFESIAPFSFTEIHFWQAATGRSLDTAEITWLIAMDDAWLDEIAKERKARNEREKEEAERNKQQSRK